MKQEQLGPLKVAVLVSVNHLPTGLRDTLTASIRNTPYGTARAAIVGNVIAPETATVAPRKPRRAISGLVMSLPFLSALVGVFSHI